VDVFFKHGVQMPGKPCLLSGENNVAANLHGFTNKTLFSHAVSFIHSTV